METIKITTTDGIFIEAEVTHEQLESDVFTIETSDYMIEITNGEDNSYISNAMNGYRHNCRDMFKDAIVDYNLI